MTRTEILGSALCAVGGHLGYMALCPPEPEPIVIEIRLGCHHNQTPTVRPQQETAENGYPLAPDWYAGAIP